MLIHFAIIGCFAHLSFPLKKLSLEVDNYVSDLKNYKNVIKSQLIYTIDITIGTPPQKFNLALSLDAHVKS